MSSFFTSLSLSLMLSGPLPDAVRDALQDTADARFHRLLIASAVVAIGVALEAPEATITLVRWFRLWRGKEVAAPNEKSWAIPASYLGLLLVIGGVVGEGVYEALVSNSDTALRLHDSQILGQTQMEAGDAKDSALIARGAADRANASADAAGKTADKSKKGAASALKLASAARKEVADTERELKEEKARALRSSLPRWTLTSPLTKYLADKPAGLLEIVFAPDDDEAQKTATSIWAWSGWRAVNLPHPYSEADALPRFLTPEMKKNVFNSTTFERVGGFSDITLIISPADVEPNKPFLPRSGTAAEALWRGLISCGFQPSLNEDERLPAGTVRVVVGPKQ